MAEPADEEVIAAWRRKELESEREYLKHLELEYRDCKNALYVWDAISRITEGPELTEAGGQAFPPWVVEYLKEASSGVMSLACGLDYVGVRKRSGFAQLTDEEKWTALRRKVPPTECAEQSAEVLGFTSPGKNAFAEHRSRESVLEDFSDYISMLEEGMSATEAIRELMEKKGTDDDRNVRRRIAAAKRRYQGEVS